MYFSDIIPIKLQNNADKLFLLIYSSFKKLTITKAILNFLA